MYYAQKQGHRDLVALLKAAGAGSVPPSRQSGLAETADVTASAVSATSAVIDSKAQLEAQSDGVGSVLELIAFVENIAYSFNLYYDFFILLRVVRLNAYVCLHQRFHHLLSLSQSVLPTYQPLSQILNN